MVTQVAKTLAMCPRCRMTCYLVGGYCQRCGDEIGLNFRPAGDINIMYPSQATPATVPTSAFYYTTRGGERIIRKPIS